MEITEKTAAIEAMTELGWLYVDGETVRLAKIKRAVEAYNAALAGRPVEAGSMVDKAEAWGAIAAKNAEIASLVAAIAERDERIEGYEAAFDKQETNSGVTSDGNLWRFWAKKAKTVATKYEHLFLRAERLGMALEEIAMQADNHKASTAMDSNGHNIALVNIRNTARAAVQQLPE